MCGIGGAWHFRCDQSEQALVQIGHNINSALVHRGPDSEGLFHDVGLGVVIAHRRLTIIDKSSNGSQPMRSSCGRYIFSYNGELYNHREIRKELEQKGRTFRGTSDSEVFLEGISEFGIEEMLNRTNGMFAFCLFDLSNKNLFLARDRIGIKPLFYGIIGDILYFGSELKAIIAHPDFTPRIDSNSVGSYVRFSYIPTPATIYQGIKKLEPGSFIRVSDDKTISPTIYWQVDEAIQSGARGGLFSPGEATHKVEELLKDSIERQLVADVPVGVFLSGGIDSSLLAALGQEVSDKALSTFSVGFEDRKYDEANFAKAISKNLGTVHQEIYVSERDAMTALPEMPLIFDEPFGDSSQIPTYLISRETGRNVKVALSGDGADEVFGGYKRYVSGERALRFLNSMPRIVELVTKKVCRKLSSRYGGAPIVIPGRNVSQGVLERALEIGSLERYDFKSIYEVIISHWPKPEYLVRDLESYPPLFVRPIPEVIESDPLSVMQYIDLQSYLNDDILVKVDRASMANSLEVRVPFLDHRIIELFSRLPRESKIANSVTKTVLREILSKRLPRTLFDRPKMGFGIPLDSWLRGGLSEWAEDMLNPSMLRKSGFFYHEPIIRRWQEHQAGKANWGYWLWDILMFQGWLESQR
jgi:asparagine synthase (glutamine-hydrolysing)